MAMRGRGGIAACRKATRCRGGIAWHRERIAGRGRAIVAPRKGSSRPKRLRSVDLDIIFDRNGFAALTQ